MKASTKRCLSFWTGYYIFCNSYSVIAVASSLFPYYICCFIISLVGTSIIDIWLEDSECIVFLRVSSWFSAFYLIFIFFVWKLLWMRFFVWGRKWWMGIGGTFFFHKMILGVFKFSGFLQFGSFFKAPGQIYFIFIFLICSWNFHKSRMGVILWLSCILGTLCFFGNLRAVCPNGIGWMPISVDAFWSFRC